MMLPAVRVVVLPSNSIDTSGLVLHAMRPGAIWQRRFVRLESDVCGPVVRLVSIVMIRDNVQLKHK